MIEHCNGCGQPYIAMNHGFKLKDKNNNIIFAEQISVCQCKHKVNTLQYLGNVITGVKASNNYRFTPSDFPEELLKENNPSNKFAKCPFCKSRMFMAGKITVKKTINNDLIQSGLKWFCSVCGSEFIEVPYDISYHINFVKEINSFAYYILIEPKKSYKKIKDFFDQHVTEESMFNEFGKNIHDEILEAIQKQELDISFIEINKNKNRFLTATGKTIYPDIFLAENIDWYSKQLLNYTYLQGIDENNAQFNRITTLLNIVINNYTKELSSQGFKSGLIFPIYFTCVNMSFNFFLRLFFNTTIVEIITAAFKARYSFTNKSMLNQLINIDRIKTLPEWTVFRTFINP